MFFFLLFSILIGRNDELINLRLICNNKKQVPRQKSEQTRNLILIGSIHISMNSSYYLFVCCWTFLYFYTLDCAKLNVKQKPIIGNMTHSVKCNAISINKQQGNGRYCFNVLLTLTFRAVDIVYAVRKCRRVFKLQLKWGFNMQTGCRHVTTFLYTTAYNLFMADSLLQVNVAPALN